MLFGLLLLPIIGAIGMAIDFGFILTSRTKAQVAADAAALHAAGVARDLIKASDGGDAATAAALAEAKRRAELLFKAHAEQSTLKDYSATVTVARSGQNITSTASFNVNTTTHIAKLFGHNTYSATGAAVSSSSLPNYVDVYLALDNSQSMGLAETQAEMIRLWDATTEARKTDSKIESCVFGCHVPSDGAKTSGETIAKANNIRMRIDVLRDAVRQMIDSAESNSESSSIYRFAISTMGINSSLNGYELKEVSALSGNFGSLKSKLPQIQLGAYNNTGGLGDTYVNEQLSQLNNQITAPGDGSSQNNPKKYLFLVTDGVRDVNGSCTWGHCTSPIDSSYCTGLKTKGITVGVIYTTFLPIYANPRVQDATKMDGRYNTLVKSFAGNIKPALVNCASPNWFEEASDGPAIERAVARMFKQTTSTPHLTN